MLTRTQQKQFGGSINDISDAEGKHPLNSFPLNLAEVLKTKVLESKGFEIL